MNTEQISDTPETDANLQQTSTTTAIYVFADFARRLERERDAARKERDMLADALRWTLPLAKGYASQNLAVASNARMIASAEEALASLN